MICEEPRSCLTYQWRINTRSIYHLLSRAFGQCVAVAKIVHFDVSNVVAVCNVHLTIDCAGAVSAGGLGRCGCAGRGAQGL